MCEIIVRKPFMFFFVFVWRHGAYMFTKNNRWSSSIKAYIYYVVLIGKFDILNLIFRSISQCIADFCGMRMIEGIIKIGNKTATVAQQIIADARK
jgi:hypothetical protein